MNLTYLALGVGFLLVGIIAIGSSRQRPGAPNQDGKARSSPLGTLGMFFLGLGLVVLLLGL